MEKNVILAHVAPCKQSAEANPRFFSQKVSCAINLHGILLLEFLVIAPDRDVEPECKGELEGIIRIRTD